MLDQIVNQIHDAVIVFDTDGFVQSWNKSATRMYGYNQTGAIGQHISFLYHPLDLEILTQRVIPAVFQTGRYESEVLTRSKSGEMIHTHLNLSLFRNKSGKAKGIIGYFYDINERKRADEQLSCAQKLEILGIIASSIAHDFNNLLGAIMGNVELGLLNVDIKHPAYQDFIEIKRTAGKANELTNQLLRFSRPHVSRKKYLNVNKLITEFIKMLKLILGKGTELKMNLASELSPIFADPGLIEQVLMNLFVNARDAMQKQGKLTLETHNVTSKALKKFSEIERPHENYVEIKIKDTGVGIDKNTMMHIFEPFFSTKEKGTGLGLAVVQGIMKQSDGHIHAESKVNKGSTFRVFFPSKPFKKVIEMRDKKQSMDNQDETILVVEDNETVRKMAEQILNELNYNVLIAKDGKEAIDIFETKQSKIDLVIMDVILPKEKSADVYSTMTSIKPNIPVLFVSGHKNELTVMKINQSGTVLQKSFTKDSLSQKISSLLDKSIK